jgi:hypothetical protein
MQSAATAAKRTYGCCLPDPRAHQRLACPLGSNQGVSHHSHHHLGLIQSEEALGQTKLLNDKRPAGGQ